MNKALRILIVDDQVSMRRIVRNSLVELGFRHIGEAEDGAQALALMEQQPFDFVMTDRHMPNLDGIGLLRAIRANAALSHIPVLLVTSDQQRDSILEAIEAKVNGYIVKPFTSGILLDKLDKIFKAKPPATAGTGTAQPATRR